MSDEAETKIEEKFEEVELEGDAAEHYNTIPITLRCKHCGEESHHRIPNQERELRNGLAALAMNVALIQTQIKNLMQSKGDEDEEATG